VQTIIADTGFWLALLFRRDTHHARAAEVYPQFKGGLITTWPILTEASYLLCRRVGAEAAPALLDRAGRAFKVWEMPAEAASRAALLMRAYAALPMDLADASAVLLAEHLGHGRILSTDRRDFAAYRWKHRHPFENLLLPA
jgi:predicted nucleic acid-binding protein